MELAMRVEIHFHQQDEVSVFLESGASGDQEKFGEVLLWCLYAIRTMVNLGSGPISASLANLLSQAEDLVAVLSDHEHVGEYRLVSYHGTPGRKRFEASLNFSDSKLRFTLNPIGFGVLGRGVGYYAPTSVLALLQHLCRRRASEPEHLNCLARAAQLCAAAWDSNRVTLMNQHQMALAIASSAMSPDECESNDGKSEEFVEVLARFSRESLTTACRRHRQ